MLRNSKHPNGGSSTRRLNEPVLRPSLETEGEDLIWERFKAGSETALTYIYRNYSNQLFNYGIQFTPDRGLLKDCIQDLFEELIKRRERLSSTTSIKFYLMKAFRNRLVKALRKDKRRQESEKISLDEGFQVAVSAEVRLINGQLDEAKKKLLSQKLNQLPPLQREALILYFYEGLKYQQVAEMLGIKTKSSRELVYRAIKSLEGLITPHKDRITLFAIAVLVMKSLAE